ncbi:MAG: DUF3619 family protein [Ideonella sp.]|nr:DUF3619 family protein [Ideonella sp.]MCC7457995.1 DUF3619 family protein [Nitrospira sp.]
MNASARTSQAAFAQTAHHEVVEARVALRIAGQLSQAAEQLPHDITERLRVARGLALERARVQRRLSTAPAVHAQGGTLALSGPSWWLRLASLAPLALLVVGLLAIERSYVNQQIRAAAEIDEAILTDDLPPQAYSDPGFAEYLKSPKTGD